MLKQWIVLKVPSDWRFLYTSEQPWEKMASWFASVTSEEMTQINGEASVKPQRKRLNLVRPCLKAMA